MTHRATRRTVRFGGALLIGCTAFLTSCGGETGAADLEEEPLGEEVPEGTSLVIADQQERLQVALEASGELEELSFDYEFANFVGGPAILEAFRGGAADVATVGDTPPIHAFASGETVPIISASRVSPEAYRLATSPQADLDSLEDLEGARIAYAEGTAQASIVLRALDRAGLSTDDVELVRIELNEYSEALQTDAVDVAPLAEPLITRYLNDYEEEGAGYVNPEETSDLSTGLSFLYAREETLQDEDQAAALRELVEAHLSALHWINENPDEWIEAYYVESQGVSAEEGERIMEDQGVTAFPRLDEELVAEQQSTVDLTFDAGELPVEVDADEMFDFRFDEVIEEKAAELGASHER